MSKILNTLLFLFCNKMLVLSGLGLIKCLSEWQTGKTLIRLLLKKSDLGMSCLSMPFGQVTSVQNF